jgi:glutathione S-transferase
MTAELILHHYPASPFSEKVRLVLGAKRLAWRSVHIPVVMPKPDLVALTGGYRRTPVLQIGADIYCDTALICRVLDARQPTPPLYPAAGTPAAGLAQVLSQWADSMLFWVAVPYTLQPAGLPFLFGMAPPEVVKAFTADRAALRPAPVRPTPADVEVALREHLASLESLLADGRRFLVGAEPGIADFSVAHSLWFIQRVPPVATVLDGHPRLQAWLAGVLAFGHGESSPMSSAEALAAAAAAGSVGFAPAQVEAGLGFEAGDSVCVTPTDYGFDPVHGSLVGLTRDSVTLCRRDERAGVLQIHFPRLGFQVRHRSSS